MEAEKETTPNNVNTLPHHPGVYLFRDKNGAILYIGKAIDLNRRVKQYFRSHDAIGPKTNQLVTHIHRIKTIRTANEFDALLLETRLIGLHKPKYNSISKDDKSPLYICLTLSEQLPQVLYVRGRQLPFYQKDKRTIVIGPFQSSRMLRLLMRRLRRSIPFCTQKVRNGKPCFYTHIGLCDPCPSIIEKLAQGPARQSQIVSYRRHMMAIRDILMGKMPFVLRSMEQEMKNFSDSQQFEKALLIKQQRDQLYALYRERRDVSLYLEEDSALEHMNSDALELLRKTLHPYFLGLHSLSRIECIDISTLGGAWPSGSLVVLTSGAPDTSEYRRFRIRTKPSTRPIPEGTMMTHGSNDVAMIEEVLRRRFKHSEWKKPNLLVVDGGKPQVASAQKVLEELSPDIPLVGLAKRLEEIIFLHNKTFQTIHLPLTHPGLQILQRARDEAHRFAKNYHHILRKKISPV